MNVLQKWPNFEIHFHISGKKTLNFEMTNIWSISLFIKWSFSFLNAIRISKMPVKCNIVLPVQQWPCGRYLYRLIVLFKKKHFSVPLSIDLTRCTFLCDCVLCCAANTFNNTLKSYVFYHFSFLNNINVKNICSWIIFLKGQCHVEFSYSMIFSSLTYIFK